MSKKLLVLVACEESQAVANAFRALGHEAYSCDIQPCSGGHPEYHIQGDALEALKGINGRKWDLVIAHPPCTYLAAVGANHLFAADHTIKNPERYQKGLEAAEFFRKFLECDCEHVAVENPVMMHIWHLPPPTQFVQPYEHGHPYTKKTGLWLRGLPPLKPTNVVPIITEKGKCWELTVGGGKDRAKNRSKTFPGIAKAMAEQWSEYLLELEDKTWTRSNPTNF